MVTLSQGILVLESVAVSRRQHNQVCWIWLESTYHLFSLTDPHQATPGQVDRNTHRHDRHVWPTHDASLLRRDDIVIPLEYNESRMAVFNRTGVE